MNKELTAIDRQVLESVEALGHSKFVNYILENSKPLTPFISDAFAEGHARFTEREESELEEEAEKYLTEIKF